jgi:MYXO-CTERM domain-containing protein
MKTLAIAVVGSASLVASADAGFAGFVASVRNSGAYTIIDIFAGVQNASDKFLNVYNTKSDATGGFFQATGLANKTWKPDAASFNSTRSSIDSFMTAGTYSGGAYGGEFYASTNTTGDPNFTGTSWSGTPASPAANTIPANAGWYTADPTSVDNGAQLLAPLSVGYTRFDSFATPTSGGTGATVGSANSLYGIWCSHIVIAGTLNSQMFNNGMIAWIGSASIKDGVTGATTQGISNMAPAPGALALLGLAGFASRRRRA